MSERIGTSRTPDLFEVLAAAMENRIAEIHVAMPGIVKKYNPATQTVDVLPLLKCSVVLDDGEVESEELPVLSDVPILFMRGGGFFLSLPIVPGDAVELIFNERSIDKFVNSSGVLPIDPVDLRKHDLSDAVAIPVSFTLSKALKETLGSSAIFGKEKGCQLRATGSTMEVTTTGAPSAADFVALAAKVLSELAKIKAKFDLHTHIYSPGPLTPVATATPLPVLDTPSSVASTNLKAD
jgi:hypothetical protein